MKKQRTIILSEEQFRRLNEKKHSPICGDTKYCGHPFSEVENKEPIDVNGRPIVPVLTIENDLKERFYIVTTQQDPNFYLIYHHCNRKYPPQKIATIPPDAFMFLKKLPL